MCEIKIKPYVGYIEKLKEPIELKGRVIKYKPVAKLSKKTSAKKGGQRGGAKFIVVTCQDVGAGNRLVTAEAHCKQAKDYIMRDITTKDYIVKIDDLSSSSFKVFIKPENQVYDLNFVKSKLDRFFGCSAIIEEDRTYWNPTNQKWVSY